MRGPDGLHPEADVFVPERRRQSLEEFPGGANWMEMRTNTMAHRRVLLVGESWFTFSLHQKGADTFQTAEYTEGATYFIAVLRSAGYEVDYIAAHRVDADFPRAATDLDDYSVIILSDVGANTFLLTKETFAQSRIVPNRLQALRGWVERGGGLLMVGGYMSFAGIDGKARYGSSPLAPVLPVEVLAHDDRVEVPEGFQATVLAPEHPAISGLGEDWPHLLGYNRVLPRASGTILAEYHGDPILAVGEFGAGRTAAFTSDLAPHWAPPEFLQWEGYPALWDGILRWLAGP
jgi:uncharacterized membrane protein